MAVSAFKSTTKRTQLVAASATCDAGSSNRNGAHRRSRSLSRYSGRLPPPELDSDRQVRRGRFVNTVRGSDFPEISLDDIADEFLMRLHDEERGRAERRISSAGLSGDASQRRGRSVSRSHAGGDDALTSRKMDINWNNSRPRRSLSVAQYHLTDSESDRDHSCNSGRHEDAKNIITDNSRRLSLDKSVASGHPPAVRRSLSQLELAHSNDEYSASRPSHSHNGYSNHSSVLTEIQNDCQRDGLEKTICAVYSEKLEHPTGEGDRIGMYEVMRKEVRHAVDEIKTELEEVIGKVKPTALTNIDFVHTDGSEAVRAIGEMRKYYTVKLEESERRKQELLAELAAEEQRSCEISKVIKELLPEPKQFLSSEKSTRTRKSSNERGRMSRRLTEEAEKYFKDFLSNVEDTDYSSIDGEKSDASLTQDVKAKPASDFTCSRQAYASGTLPASVVTSQPVEMDGLVLPWLQWEANDECTPVSSISKGQPLCSSGVLCSSTQELSTACSRCIVTSHGSCDSGHGLDSATSGTGMNISSKETFDSSTRRNMASFFMDEYMKLQDAEDDLLEKFRARHRIEFGGLLVCPKIIL